MEKFDLIAIVSACGVWGGWRLGDMIPGIGVIHMNFQLRKVLCLSTTVYTLGALERLGRHDDALKVWVGD